MERESKKQKIKLEEVRSQVPYDCKEYPAAQSLVICNNISIVKQLEGIYPLFNLISLGFL